jgi:hypothetical protein
MTLNKTGNSLIFQPAFEACIMNSRTNILQLMVTPNTDPTDGNKSMSLKLSFDQVSETIIYR